MRRFVSLHDLRIITGLGSHVMPICSALIASRAGLHPWSSTLHQSSPGILDSKVSSSSLLIPFIGLQIDQIAIACPR